MKSEKGAALLLETAIIMPMILFVIIMIYFSAVYVIQKNVIFAKSYHYSQIAAKIATKSHLINKGSDEFNITAQHYMTQYDKLQPYASLSQQKLSQIEQDMASVLQQKNMMSLDAIKVKVSKRTNTLCVPKIAVHVQYQVPIISYMESVFRQNTDGFMSMAPMIQQAQFINHLQLARQIMARTRIGQNIKDVWHKINYFLNKVKR